MKHLIFVYGNERMGFPLNTYLRASTLKYSVWTTECFKMYDLGDKPAVVEGGSKEIYGEVWEVDDNTLEVLDNLYGNHVQYTRRIMTIEHVCDCWIYIIRNRPAELITSGDWKNARPK